MDQEQRRDHPRHDFFEEFKILRNSEYWPYLSQKNQQEILSLLDEQQDPS